MTPRNPGILFSFGRCGPMLNTVERSRSKKTAGLAATYRAAPGDM